MQSEATETTPVGKLLPKKAVAQTLAVCNRTVMMRVKEDPSFPRPITLNKRIYFLEPEVENYKRLIIAKSMSRGARDASR
jgi:predicted DNA-binding transcriptional regulator AlpA